MLLSLSVKYSFVLSRSPCSREVIRELTGDAFISGKLSLLKVPRSLKHYNSSWSKIKNLCTLTSIQNSCPYYSSLDLETRCSFLRSFPRENNLRFLWRKNACWSLSRRCKQTLEGEIWDLVLKPGERNSRFPWFRTQKSKADNTAEHRVVHLSKLPQCSPAHPLT